MAIDNKAVARRLYEQAWNKRRVEVVDEVISPSHALHDPHFYGSSIGPAAYKSRISHFLAAFPDLRFTIEDMVTEKDKVAVSWTFSGTHKGDFEGIAPTNKKISVEGITIHHLANGKIMDSYASWDALGLLQQLGAVPRLGQSRTLAAR